MTGAKCRADPLAEPIDEENFEGDARLLALERREGSLDVGECVDARDDDGQDGCRVGRCRKGRGSQKSFEF